MDLNALRQFVLVAAHGSFGKASRAQAIPKASLSWRVRDLEDALGMRLIDRSSRGFRLTHEGQMMAEGAGPLIDELLQLEQRMRSRGLVPRGPLRISAPIVFAQVSLGALAAEYCARYP